MSSLVLKFERVFAASSIDPKLERRSAFAAEKGLLVIRYMSSGALSDFPVAIVRPAPGSEQVVEVISEPGSPQGRLEKPSDFLVVRVHEPARLEIGLGRSAPAGSLDASFSVEMLGAGKTPSALQDSSNTLAGNPRSTLSSDFRKTSATVVEAAVKAPTAPKATSEPASILVQEPARLSGARVVTRADVEVGDESSEIRARVQTWAGGPEEAGRWYRSQPIAAFGDRTAEALVKSGHAEALRDYLDSIALGGFA